MSTSFDDPEYCLEILDRAAEVLSDPEVDAASAARTMGPMIGKTIETLKKAVEGEYERVARLMRERSIDGVAAIRRGFDSADVGEGHITEIYGNRRYVMVYTVERDCDMVVSRWVSLLIAKPGLFLDTRQQMLLDAEGPCSISILDPADYRGGPQWDENDLIAEATEDGHPHSVHA